MSCFHDHRTELQAIVTFGLQARIAAEPGLMRPRS